MTPKPITDDEEELLVNLKDGYTAYRCSKCGHLVGDEKDVDEWHGACPGRPVGCGKMTLFKRVSHE